MTESASVGADGALGTDLPPSWAVTTLGTVTDYGKTVKVEPADIPASAWVLELEDIEKDSSRILQRLTQSQRQSLSTKNRFDAGDVLYGKLRPYLNKVVIADAPGFCTTEIVPVQAGPALERRYLFHWLKHPAFLKYVEAASHGMNMPRLGTDAGRAAPLILAPRPEQTRIADQLDTMLARIQACQDRLEAIPALLKRFRQSVLTAAVSGDLTSEWRDTEGQNDTLPAFAEGNLADTTQAGLALSLPGSWRIVQARNVVQPDAGIVYGIVQPGPKLANGIRYVQTTDIVDGRIQLQSLCHTSEEIANGYRRSSIRKGDVLLGIIRALKVAVVPEDLEGANISRSVARLRPREGVLPKFLAYALQSPVVQEWLRSQHRGMDMPVLNLSEVRLAPIPIAPIGEQAEIVGRVDSLFALADAIQTRYTAALGQMERMAPVLLTKAFRGELCPQDPNDEPASALLARVAAERNAPAPTRRPRSSRVGRTPRAPKDTASMTKSRQDDDVMGQPYLADHLRRIGTPASAEALFKMAELPVADFYKQLAWEVDQGHVEDNQTTLEPGHAAG